MILRKRIVSVILVLIFLMGAFLCVSCKKEDDSGNDFQTLDECIGDYNYDAPVVAFVYEQIEGEQEGFMGIQYREVLDLNSIIHQDDIAVCLYFYNSSSTGTLGITAGVEDLAQTLVGKVLFIGIDAFSEGDLSSTFEVEAYPEFVLVRNGLKVSTFRGMDYDSWDMNDVTTWISSNGYVPDYSMLDY